MEQECRGAFVHEYEGNEFAATGFLEICESTGVTPNGFIVHSDNGAAMKGSTMVRTLEDLGVHRSLSRPRVRTDIAYIESTFATVKGRPSYPDRPFSSLGSARVWMDEFVRWYNEEHRHSGISFVTPAQRHAGQHEELLAGRERVYAKARGRHAERWSGETRAWDRHEVVRLNPRKGLGAAEVEIIGDVRSPCGNYHAPRG